MLDHIGIDVSDFAASRAFYERALEPLGISVLMEVGNRRPRYHPTYYAGFVLDPGGNNIEAVCHRPA